jgi:hypothetical protein
VIENEVAHVDRGGDETDVLLAGPTG